jgi:hypothetical protein
MNTLLMDWVSRVLNHFPFGLRYDQQSRPTAPTDKQGSDSVLSAQTMKTCWYNNFNMGTSHHRHNDSDDDPPSYCNILLAVNFRPAAIFVKLSTKRENQ